MQSARLTYQPLAPSALEDFHRLVQDDHVRRYLMDGQLFSREWSAQRVRDSESLFERRGVGLWLTRETATYEVIGFCGFLVFPSMHPEPQLVYALFERFTGHGFATEMARAAIAEARRHRGFATIHAGVDAVNTVSVRILEKLGFRVVATETGRFGDLLVLSLDA